MKKATLITKLVIGLVLPAALLLRGSLANADQYGLDATAGAAGLANSSVTLPVLIGNVIGTALSMIGVLFFALMIYAGFLIMTANGNDDQLSKGYSTMIAAVIGLIIVVASAAITNFVFTNVSNGQCVYKTPENVSCIGDSENGDCTGVEQKDVCQLRSTCCVWR